MADKAVSYIAHAVSRVDGRDYWTRIGVAFSNEKSADHPLSIVINPGVTVAGKIVLSVPKAKDDDHPDAA
jgi:hypothetical protein